jgi:ketosteroid isomerase-like protein
MKPPLLALALTLPVLAAGAAWALTPVQDFDRVIAAERAFAADALKRGLGPSFVRAAAPDAVVMQPDVVNAQKVYGAQTPKPGAPALKWWPVHGGIARSGDLAFDTGPWVYGADKAHGWFLTIWRKRPDGQWRWVLDHGLNSLPSKLGPETRPTRLKIVDPGPLDPIRAFDQVQAEEKAMSAETADGRTAAAYAARLGQGAWIAGFEPEPLASDGAGGEATVKAALAKRPQTLSTELLGGDASQAGDLAFTYGKARWTGAEGKTAEGRYVRIWQRQHGHWRIVMDEVTPI